MSFSLICISDLAEENNEEDFPDVNLKAVGHGSDSDGNRLLSEEENRNVSSIACSPEFISDLTRD